jgi:3-hydroxyisobutyrate dehydrogenase-like beta-hydroxyacid dehydrogenase
MTKVGVIGLGVMGLAMAQNLMRSGFVVHGYDINPTRKKLFKAAKGSVCRSVQALAEKADVLITSLPSAAALMTVCHSLAETQSKKLTVIETSTLPIKEKMAARRLLSQTRMVLLDCPLSGTGSQAQNKDLVVYGSGPSSAFKKVKLVMEGFSRSQFYLGAFGNGMKLKMVANYLVAIHNAATAEALILAERSHLNLDLVLAAIADSAGQSKMWQIRGPRMAAADYSPMMSMHLWQKDMGIISEFVADAGAPSPVFDRVRALYALAYQAGHGDSDSSVIHHLLKSMPISSFNAPLEA